MAFLFQFFFINVGLNFKVNYLFDVNVLIGAIIFSVVLLIIRYISMVHFLFTGISLKIFLIAPIAMSFPLTLMVTVAMFGRSYNILTEKKESAVLIITALLTAVAYPILTKWMARKLFT